MLSRITSQGANANVCKISKVSPNEQTTIVEKNGLLILLLSL